MTIMEYVKPVLKDILNKFEIIKELLSKARGTSGVPLNYVIRTDFPLLTKMTTPELIIPPRKRR